MGDCGRGARIGAAGAVVWGAGTVALLVGGGGGTLLPVMLLLAAALAVPLAAPLHPALPGAAGAVAVAAAVPLAVALTLPPGLPAAALAVPWLGVATAGALLSLRWWLDGCGVVRTIWPAAACYLVVGAGWALADRAGLAPLGFGEPLVILTAIHFHYAGALTAVLVGCAHRRRPADRLVRVAGAASLLGPPLVAVGFALAPVAQIAGAAVLTAGLWALAWVTGRRIAPGAPPIARGLLVASALAVPIPMLLALQWAVGSVLGTPALSIPTMAATHGVANGVGFALLGVIGWRLAERASPAVVR
jgi:hypothetical protein